MSTLTHALFLPLELKEAQNLRCLQSNFGGLFDDLVDISKNVEKKSEITHLFFI